MSLSKLFPFPLSRYANGVLWRLPVHGVRLVIYDQLNPHYAKYYTKAEAKTFLHRAGFINIQVQRRLGYSWTVYGRKALMP